MEYLLSYYYFPDNSREVLRQTPNTTGNDLNGIDLQPT